MADVRLTVGSEVEIAAHMAIERTLGFDHPRPLPDDLPRGPAALADYVRKHLAQRLLAFVPSDGGLFYWSKADGRWRLWPESEIRNHARLYDGIPYGSMEAKTQANYRVTLDRITNILCALQDWTFAPSFFRDGNPSYCISGVTAILGAKDLWGAGVPAERCWHGITVAFEEGWIPDASPPVACDELVEAILRVIAPNGDRAVGLHQLQQLEEWVGLAVCGAATHWQRGLILLGRIYGSNGKKWLMDLIRSVFDPLVCMSRSGVLDLGADYQRGELAGKLLFAASELDDVGSVKILGGIVTGDVMGGRHIGKDPFPLQPRAGIVWDCNDLPTLRRGSIGGVRRRWIPIECSNTFNQPGASRVDARHLHDLIRKQGPGWAWRCVQAANAVYLRGTLTPANARQSGIMDEWLQEGDPLASWVSQYFTHADGAPLVGVSNGYEAFRVWHTAHHGDKDIPTLNGFARRVHAMLPEGCGRTRITGGRWAWTNLVITTDEPERPKLPLSSEPYREPVERAPWVGTPPPHTDDDAPS